MIASILAEKLDGLTGLYAFRGVLAVAMFMTLAGAAIANGGLKGMGWIPRLRDGKIKTYLLAWLLPPAVTLLGAVLYYAIFPSQMGTPGAYYQQLNAQYGLDLTEKLSEQGIDLNTYIVIQIASMFPAAFLNAIVAVGEETGWRGFLNPLLKARFGRGKGLLLGGIIWGVWHFPVMLLAGYEYGTEYFGAPFLGMIVFCISTVSLGIIADYTYEKTGSIWAPALYHGSVNAFGSLAMAVMSPDYEKYVILGPLPVGLIAMIPTVIAAVLLYRKGRKEAESWDSLRPSKRSPILRGVKS